MSHHSPTEILRIGKSAIWCLLFTAVMLFVYSVLAIFSSLTIFGVLGVILNSLAFYFWYPEYKLFKRYVVDSEQLDREKNGTVS